MSDKKTVLREKLIPVKGTTKLWIGDPWYKGMKNEKKLIFSGNISGAPAGIMQIQEVEIKSEDLSFPFRMIEVAVYQASDRRKLETYLSGKYYTGTIKKEMELGCDTACFEIETKYSFDHINTGGDGYYGYITQYKQYYGMKLELSFDADLYDFEEIEERMLSLFPEKVLLKTP